VRTFTFSILPRDRTYAAEVACAGDGAREELNNERRGAIRDQSMGYFDFLEQSTRSEEVIWTSPYVDNFGLGLLLTLGRPVITPDGRCSEYLWHTNCIMYILSVCIEWLLLEHMFSLFSLSTLC